MRSCRIIIQKSKQSTLTLSMKKAYTVYVYPVMKITNHLPILMFALGISNTYFGYFGVFSCI